MLSVICVERTSKAPRKMPGNASTRAPHLAVDVCPAALPTSLSANPTWRRSRVLTAQAAFGFSPGLVVALGSQSIGYQLALGWLWDGLWGLKRDSPDMSGGS